MKRIEPIELFQKNGHEPLIIAGPCSAESETQVMDTARSLADSGVRIFRAGVWKPRTKPGCFEGVGAPGLEWLRKVRDTYGMAVATEVANAHHVEEVMKAGIDIIWIGARTVANPFAVQEIAESLKGTDKAVMVKNPVNPDLDLWIGAIERLEKCGIRRMAAIHRGFSTYGEKVYRNAPQWQIPIELRRLIPELPILCDPSHMGGKRNLVISLSQQAMDFNADGLFIEVHNDPCHALSDAAQQLSPEEFRELQSMLVTRTRTSHQDDSLSQYREQIDDCDRRFIGILKERLMIADDIGRFKKEHNMAILQSDRYKQIIEALVAEGIKSGIDPECIRSIFESIHIESIRRQMKVREKNGDCRSNI